MARPCQRRPGLQQPTTASYRPVVLMHGLGDAGSNPGMQSLAQSVRDAYPGIHAVSVDVADGLASFLTPMWEQVEQFAAVVRADPQLAGGFNVVGLSQGGPVVRGYIEAYNDPPVHRFVSICGVQGGEFNCPLEMQIIPFVCDIFQDNPYHFLFNGSIPLSFSDYWVDVNFTRYMTGESERSSCNGSHRNTAQLAVLYAENTFLVPLNNQQDDASLHNATYKANWQSLDHLVLIEATEDTVVYPYQSEQFGGYLPGSTKAVYNYTTWQPYLQDSFGLKSLFDAGKVTLGSYKGDHLRFSTQYWEDTVLPWFNDTMPSTNHGGFLRG